MRRSAFLLITAVTLWGTLAAASASQDATPAAEGQEHLGRFRAVLVGTGAPVEDGRCPALTIAITGPGTATHLGSFTTEQDHCVDPTGDTPLAFTDGHYTFTAEDGSSITGIYNGWMVPTESTAEDGLYLIEGRFTIQGGTGRFEGASGSGVADGLQNLETGKANLVLDGTIVYPGQPTGGTTPAT